MRVLAVAVLIALLGVVGFWRCAPDRPALKLPERVLGDPVVVVPAPAADVDMTSRVPATSAPATSAPAWVGDGVLVRVIEAATGQPVPRAEVCWYSPSAGAPVLSASDYQARTLDPEAFHRQRGQCGETDAQGALRLPVERWVAVAARAGSLYGEAFARRTGGELVVALHPDEALAIRTVDGAGQPVAGVRVRFAGIWRDPGKDPVRWSALLPASDARGLVHLPHVQEFTSPRVADRLAQFSFSRAVAWQSAQLCVSVTQHDGEPVAVDLEHLPSQPIDVVMPATGSVELVLLGADSAPITLQTGPDLRAVLVPTGGMAQPIEAGIHTAPWAADGRAVFPHVGCGERLELLDRTNWYAGIKFDGPARQGERRVVQVSVPIDSVWIVGRLVGEDGRPWTRDATIRMGGNTILPGNPQGLFCVPVPDHVGRQPGAFIEGEHGAFEAELVFSAPLAVGRNDIGVVVLRQLPLLVAGQVVVHGADDALAFLKQLRVYVTSWPRGAFLGREDRDPVDLDPDGRFEVRGLPRNSKYAVVVDGNLVAGSRREFTPGTAGLVLEVAVGASIEASFLVDPAWGMLSVSFQRTGAPVGERGTSVFSSCGSGRVVVTARGLVGGEYKVIAAKGAVVLFEQLVTVPSGQPANDPRLRDVDLRGRGHQVRVTVADDRGAAIPGEVMIAWRPAGAADEQWSVEAYRHDEGRGHAIVSGGAIDLWAWATGFHAVSQTGVLETAGLVLSSMPVVTLQWAGFGDLPAGCSATLLWERLAMGPEPAPAAGQTRSAVARIREAQRGGPLPGMLRDGKARLTAERGERLQLRLQLQRNGKPGEPIALVPGELDAATFVDGQAIELSADAAAVQAALQKLMAK